MPGVTIGLGLMQPDAQPLTAEERARLLIYQGPCAGCAGTGQYHRQGVATNQPCGLCGASGVEDAAVCTLEELAAFGLPARELAELDEGDEWVGRLARRGDGALLGACVTRPGSDGVGAELARITTPRRS